MYAVFKVHIDWSFISHQKSQMLFQLHLKSLITGKFSFFFLIWRPPALPHRLQCSTIGRLGLNRRVRDGNGCFPQPHRHQKCCYSVFLDNSTVKHILLYFFFLRKEVIQPHLPIRLPCYDFTPVINPAFGSSLLAVGSLTSGVIDSHGVTGGVYKTRERIHRSILICDY